jgi:hypothetical protein
MSMLATVRVRVTSALLISVVAGCGGSPLTEPPEAPAFAKGSAGGVTVTAADPPYGNQGQLNLVVRVLGSGFDPGSRASWERGGAVDSKIHVDTTIFVSSSEIRAVIDIAGDAELAFYDVAVYTSGGRKGVGTERFEVTAAQPLAGLGHAIGINDAGMVVGGASAGGAGFWDPAVATTQILAATGLGWDIDQVGTTIAGGSDAAVIWTRASATPGSSWTIQALPSFGGGGVARGLASDASGAAAFITGHVNQPVSKRSAPRKPAKWIRSGSGWSLVVLATAGYTEAIGWGVNSTGMVAGHAVIPGGAGSWQAVVWDAAGIPSLLQPLSAGGAGQAFDVSADGSVVVGQSGNRAVLWSRTAIGWSAPLDLDVALGFPASCGSGSSSGDGRAIEINAAGIVSGQSCGAPAIWRLSGGVPVSRTQLGGLGTKNDGAAWAAAINDATPAVAAGKATVPGLGDSGALWPDL